MDHIFNSKLSSQKYMLFNRDLVSCFTEYIKGFHSVNHQQF